MNVYTTEKIRNVVLLGHSGCGKTSLVEAMAYLAGQTTRMGTVADGSTISDFDKEEIKRQFSIHTSVVPIEWDNVKINILDTPGFFDFVGEVEEAVSAADAAIIVVSGKAGIQTGTKRAWEICEKYKLPRMIFVTDMDIDNASFKDVVLKLQELYGKKIAPFHLPIRENEKFVGYVNVIQQRAKRWNESGGVDKFDVPEYSKENLGICREALVEAVAETSEEFMDRYFGGEEFSDDEIRAALRANVLEGSIVPVLMGSNILARGMYTLMADIVKYLPSPEKRSCTGINTKTNEVYNADYDFAKSKSAYVFKSIVDPYIGKYSLIKVNSGVLKTDDVLYNYHRDCDEKIGKLCISMNAADYLQLPDRLFLRREFELTPEAMELYKTLERDTLLPFADGDIDAPTAAVLTNKLLQAAGGAAYDENGNVKVLHDCKLEALDQLIEEANGQPVLVFYAFRHERDRIMERYPEAVDIKDDGAVVRWNEGKIPIMLAHPASAGHGLNLQAGGHIAIWYGLPTSLELYQQANKRLHRPGQKKTVLIHHILMKGTYDYRVLDDILAPKEVRQNACLEALKARIKEVSK